MLAGAFVIAGYLVVEAADLSTPAAVAAKIGLLALYLGALFVVPGLEPLRRGLANQLRALRARFTRRPGA
jgi:hypothetical protein